MQRTTYEVESTCSSIALTATPDNHLCDRNAVVSRSTAIALSSYTDINTEEINMVPTIVKRRYSAALTCDNHVPSRVRNLNHKPDCDVHAPSGARDGVCEAPLHRPRLLGA